MISSRPWNCLMLLVVSLLVIAGASFDNGNQTSPRAETESDPNPPSSNPDPSPDPNIRTVSWESAFWALVPIALNSMMQRSMLDGFSPWSTQLFPTRVSPIVCIADAVHALALFVLRMCYGLGPLQAAQEASVLRCPSDPSSNESGVPPRDILPSPGSASSRTVERRPCADRRLMHVVVLFLLFALGALPQAVKLFGSKGIVLTQVWAGAYLSSFGVLVLLDLLAALYRYLTPDSDLTTWADILPPTVLERVRIYAIRWHFSAFVAHPLLSVGVIGSLLRMSAGGRVALAVVNGPAWLAVGIFLVLAAYIYLLWPIMLPLLLAFALPWKPLCVKCIGHDDARCLLLPPLAFVGTSAIEIYSLCRWNIYVGWYEIVTQHVNKLIRSMPHSLITFSITSALLILISILFSSSEHSGASSHGESRPKRWSYNHSTFLFALSTFAITLLYYRFIFDSAGTVKPKWADKLG